MKWFFQLDDHRCVRIHDNVMALNGYDSLWMALAVDGVTVATTDDLPGCEFLVDDPESEKMRQIALDFANVITVTGPHGY